MILASQLARADRYMSAVEDYAGRELEANPAAADLLAALVSAVNSYRQLADDGSRLFVAERLADTLIGMIRTTARPLGQRALDARSPVADATLDYRQEIVPVKLAACSDCHDRPVVFSRQGRCVLCHLGG